MSSSHGENNLKTDEQFLFVTLLDFYSLSISAVMSSHLSLSFVTLCSTNFIKLFLLLNETISLK